MEKKYFGWVGVGGYTGVVLVDEKCDAYILTPAHKEFHRDNYYLKAKWDPGSEFEEISEAEAQKIIERVRR